LTIRFIGLAPKCASVPLAHMRPGWEFERTSLGWGVLVTATGLGLGRSLQLMRDRRDQFSAGQAFQHLKHPHWSMRRHEDDIH